MRHGDLLARMNREEKISFVSGQGFWYTRALPRLGLASVYLTDGPHGVRSLEDRTKSSDFVGVQAATAFPTASLLASSFDPELLRELGEALGVEARRRGVGMLLGPGANIKRSPLCGRNFEYFSEDPLLSSRLAAAWIRGLESKGVASSLKHFAVNSQEKRRMTMEALVDPRALREIYLASFEGAVKEGRPSSVMGAYNRLNGAYCCESPFLLEEVLRKDWGFEGLVLTDWGANNDRVRGLIAGQDLEMPDGGRGSRALLREALESEELSGEVLDRSVDRVLDFVLRATGEPLPPRPTGEEGGEGELFARHHELALRLARESMVLLKNEDEILPLAAGVPLAVVGELARTPRYQGAGSSFINPSRLESLVGALEEAKIPFDFEPAYRLEGEEGDPALEEAALALARRVGEAGGSLIYAIGLPPIFESEGFDREHLSLPANQLALFERLEAACPRVVAVWSGGSPVSTDWLPHVRALLAAYLGGQAGGAAMRDLLFGSANPSGRLAESWPLRLEDSPAYGNFGGGSDRVLYKEGIFVGYRWYASSGRPVRFPFGFGLSYTRFLYRNLVLERRSIGAEELEAGARLGFSLELANLGSRGGKEVVQAYLSFPESAIERPVLALAAWAKVELEPGASRRIELELDARALRYWDVDEGRFRVESGPVVLRLGSSSIELPLEANFAVEGGSAPRDRGPRLDLGAHPSSMSEAEFAQRFAAPLPPPRPRRPFDLASTLGDMAGESLFLRLVRNLMVAVQTGGAGTKKGEPNYRMLEEMVNDMPLGRFEAMSSDLLGPRFLSFLVEVANRRPLGALLALLGAGRRRRRG